MYEPQSLVTAEDPHSAIFATATPLLCQVYVSQTPSTSLLSVWHTVGYLPLVPGASTFLAERQP